MTNAAKLAFAVGRLRVLNQNGQIDEWHAARGKPQLSTLADHSTNERHVQARPRQATFPARSDTAATTGGASERRDQEPYYAKAESC